MTSTLDTLRNVTTGTITTMLLKKGIRRSLDGGRRCRSAFPASAWSGQAFTLRFVPVREDLATPESWSKPISTRAAIEAMPEGCIVVADAMGVTTAGIFGDILCMRMVKRGVTALVTDGVMRDKARRARHRPAGLVRGRLPRRPRSTSSPSSAGTSRSAAAAAPSSPTTSSSPTTTARW